MINESELIIWNFICNFISGICHWLLDKKVVKSGFSLTTVKHFGNKHSFFVQWQEKVPLLSKFSDMLLHIFA